MRLGREMFPTGMLPHPLHFRRSSNLLDAKEQPRTRRICSAETETTRRNLRASFRRRKRRELPTWSLRYTARLRLVPCWECWCFFFFFEVEEVLTLDFHYPIFSPKGKKTLSDEIITTSPQYHQRWRWPCFSMFQLGELLLVTRQNSWETVVWSPKTSHEWYIVMCISHWGRWLWHCGYCGSWQLYHIISSHIRTIPLVISNLRSFSSLISILNSPIWIKGANVHWVLETVIRPSRGHPKKNSRWWNPVSPPDIQSHLKGFQFFPHWLVFYSIDCWTYDIWHVIDIPFISHYTPLCLVRFHDDWAMKYHKRNILGYLMVK